MKSDDGKSAARKGVEGQPMTLKSLPHFNMNGSSSANTPLHSPTLSLNGLPSTTNGHATRGSTTKIMRRNIDRVLFGAYDIRTWYYSPYPFDEEEWASMIEGSSSTMHAPSRLNHHQRRMQTDSHLSPSSPSSTRESSLSRPGGALSTSAEKAPALQALDVEAPLLSRRDSQQALPPLAKTMWVCDGCFKYMRTYGGYTVHKKDCKKTHPPGRKVYQRGAHIIWEVDGAQEKLYAQNLSLFGKLFIDHKTIYFDVEPFTFYVLTDASSQFDHALGYFSKEKVSYDDYNLACIITFPPYQKKGYGTLMIEFSYYLSSLTTTLGTPERPLSDLGLKGYLSHWCAVVLRTLALFFYDQKPSISSCLLPASYVLATSTRHHKQSTQSAASNLAQAEARQKRETMRIRRILLGESIPLSMDSSKEDKPSSSDITVTDEGKTKRSIRGWAGEMPRHPRSSSFDQKEASNETLIESSSTHPLLRLDAEAQEITLETTLERLSIAANLREDDLCFALAELGLFSTARMRPGEEGIEAIKTIAISQETVRKAIEYNRIKRPILDVNYVLPPISL